VLSLSFSGSDIAVLQAVEGKRVALDAAIIETLNAQDLELVAFIVGSELHGQILNQVTGKLAGSIRMIPAEQEGDVITGRVEGGGGPAWYGKIWELTGHKAFDIHPVNAKALRFTVGGTPVFAMHAHIPAVGPKPFMKPAQDSHTDEILEALQGTIDEVLAG
jgi:hypothetical protein